MHLGVEGQSVRGVPQVFFFFKGETKNGGLFFFQAVKMTLSEFNRFF